MSSATFDKFKLLPADKQQEIEDFIDYLLQKYSKAITEGNVSDEVMRKRLQNFGNLKGQIWMSDNFNETTDDFKDYI